MAASAAIAFSLRGIPNQLTGNGRTLEDVYLELTEGAAA